MFVAAPTAFSFVRIVYNKRWETSFYVLVMANNYQETLMNKDQIKGRVEAADGNWHNPILVKAVK
jgi:hypothetical protein